MSELDARVFDLLDAFTAEPRRWPDWNDVMRRTRARQARRIVVAVAATLVVLGSAAGVTAALGGFHAWLSGSPGRPAPEAAQKRFAAANGRSWAAFPTSTKLRELIATEIGGKRYVLYGFRSGDSLCVELKAITLGRSTSASCVPVTVVARALDPIVVVRNDAGFHGRRAHPQALFAFGIAADGTKRVTVQTLSGTHHALLGGNAYLYVENDPNTGDRVLSIDAFANASRTHVSLPSTFGAIAPLEGMLVPPRGPTRVEAPIARPRIGWLARGERRGLTREQARIPKRLRYSLALDTQLFKPDPYSNVVVGFDNYCVAVIAGKNAGEGCSTRLFTQGPLDVLELGSGEGDISLVAGGAAADGVARIVVVDAQGRRQRVPLRSNAFAARVLRTQLPVRIVAYDRHGRVAGLHAIRANFNGIPLPSAFRGLRTMARLPGVTIEVARVSHEHVSPGIRCWVVVFRAGPRRRGCSGVGPDYARLISVDFVQPLGGRLFVVGHAGSATTRVELRFPDGDVVSTLPHAGVFVAQVPSSHITKRRRLAFVVGLDERGEALQRSGFVYKAP